MKHARLAALVPSALLAVAAVATAPPADAAAPDGAVYVGRDQGGSVTPWSPTTALPTAR